MFLEGGREGEEGDRGGREGDPINSSETCLPFLCDFDVILSMVSHLLRKWLRGAEGLHVDFED